MVHCMECTTSLNIKPQRTQSAQREGPLWFYGCLCALCVLCGFNWVVSKHVAALFVDSSLPAPVHREKFVSRVEKNGLIAMNDIQLKLLVRLPCNFLKAAGSKKVNPVHP